MHPQSTAVLQEKCTALQESVIHLKEELRGSDTRRIQLETELRTAQQELADARRQLNAAQTSLQVAEKVRNLYDDPAHFLHVNAGLVRVRIALNVAFRFKRF